MARDAGESVAEHYAFAYCDSRKAFNGGTTSSVRVDLPTLTKNNQDLRISIVVA